LHQVTLKAYYIDTTEVTQEDYQACVAAGGCSDPDAGYFASGSSDEPPNRLPVGGVSWEQAWAYCAWKKKRLPTEAEWEHAAGGPPDSTVLWCGTTPATATCLQANISACGSQTPGLSPRPVGELPAGKSAYGVYDMEGNVTEWVNDWYSGNYYGQSPKNDP